MGFWLYMVLVTLLIPAVMLWFGHRFKRSAPSKINYLFGYRTPRSMKSRETWDFAHRCCGTYWWWAGWPALTVALIVMANVMGAKQETVSAAAIAVTAIQLLFLCGVIIYTEWALKRTFDENGNQIG